MDPSPLFAVGVSLMVLGAVFAVFRRQVLTGRITRNRQRGISTRAAMVSQGSWLAAHRGASPWIVAAVWVAEGFGVVSVALGLLVATDRWQEPALVYVPMAGLLAVVLVLVAAMARGDRAARAHNATHDLDPSR